MNKKPILLALALLTTIGLYAQKSTTYIEDNSAGSIILTDFGPEGWSYQFDFTFRPFDPNSSYWNCTGVRDTLRLDLDHDGIDDSFFGSGLDHDMYAYGHPFGADVALRPLHWDSYPRFTTCDYRYCDSLGVVLYYSWAIGDTIANINEVGGDFPSWCGGFGYIIGPFISHFPRYVAYKIEKEDGCYYGWLEHSVEYTIYPGGHGDFTGTTEVRMPKVTVYRAVFCTIPNYPLRLGQTSFNWEGVEENDATAFATIHPNPTTGQVTITGENLRQAEVVNTLGQRVATATGDREQLSVDLSGQPAGVYFVTVTDEEGRKCVRKVVKE